MMLLLPKKKKNILQISLTTKFWDPTLSGAVSLPHPTPNFHNNAYIIYGMNLKEYKDAVVYRGMMLTSSLMTPSMGSKITRGGRHTEKHNLPFLLKYKKKTKNSVFPQIEGK